MARSPHRRRCRDRRQPGGRSLQASLPRPLAPNRHMIDRRREDRLDQLLRHGAPYVEANPQWVPYGERLSWLRRGKIAIMLHRPTAEAAYSIRTRLFDAIAAEVPIITTEEGFAAELVAAEGLGMVVPPGDSGA